MEPMNEYFFADVDLPFHVWVRERSVGPGFRWVLRETSQSPRDGTSEQDASEAGQAPATKGFD